MPRATVRGVLHTMSYFPECEFRTRVDITLHSSRHTQGAGGMLRMMAATTFIGF